MEALFRYAQAQAGREFTLDGAADPLGSNSWMKVFCSVIQSFFTQDLRGHQVWANPDFSLCGDYLSHFHSEQEKAPDTTDGTFLLPVWFWAYFWPLLRGGLLLALIEEGEHVFTSPLWEEQEGLYHQPEGRSSRGPTSWRVMIVHFPRSEGPAWRGTRRGRLEGQTATERGPGSGRLVLRGDPNLDRVALARHPVLTMSEVDAWWAAQHS